ncbi:hypothetical protein HPP92_013039 [Vanilla planifolia]|uniref:Uncharacterized protein n=1 Tax=Vanilla planifolia TaxID=51239 RepID=A0A835QYA7_VANPL|nr:hypothetical protein HPP92_013509 [Vanilla planifolia]KAG0478320.1 hypothetical protein HPP92_013039 [Vanilla planifolia]
MELIDAYNANLRLKGPEENNSNITIGTKKERKKGKGKQKAVDHEEKIATKDALADSFLDQVRKLQLAQYQIEDEVDALSKDGYRSTKDKFPLDREGKAPTLTTYDSSSVSGKENMESKSNGSGGRSKKTQKKSQRIRLGDGSAAALLDRRHEETSSSNTTQADGLPIRGVWRNGGGQRLFSETGTTKKNLRSSWICLLGITVSLLPYSATQFWIMLSICTGF